MSKGLEVGAVLPDFELPDDEGTPHRLSELQGENLMVLQLGRGEHCPRERQQHRELLEFHRWCAVAFTELVTILPNNAHETNKLKITTGAYWTFLCDEQLERPGRRSTSRSTPTCTTRPRSRTRSCSGRV